MISDDVVKVRRTGVRRIGVRCCKSSMKCRSTKCPLHYKFDELGFDKLGFDELRLYRRYILSPMRAYVLPVSLSIGQESCLYMYVSSSMYIFALDCCIL
jgi:hypothetical protein